MVPFVRLLAATIVLTLTTLPTPLEQDAPEPGALESPDASLPAGALAAAAVAASPTPAGPPGTARPISPELRVRLQAAMDRIEADLPGILERRRMRERFPPTRQLVLESAGVLRRVPKARMSIAGVEHEPFVLHKQGLPFFNRRGRLHSRNGEPIGTSDRLSFPPLARAEWIDASQALSAAYAHIGAEQHARGDRSRTRPTRRRPHRPR